MKLTIDKLRKDEYGAIEWLPCITSLPFDEEIHIEIGWLKYYFRIIIKK